MRKPQHSHRDDDGVSRAGASSQAPVEPFTGRLLIIFGPVLALGVFAVLLALVAGLFGWYAHEMYLVATVLGTLVMLLAIVLFYRQSSKRQTSEVALQNVEARVLDIMNSAMDAMISVDESQRIVLYNIAAEKTFLWPRAAVLGQPLDKLIPERLRAGHRGHVERFGRTGTTSRRMGDQTVLLGLRADGEEFPLEASISQHSEGGEKIFTVILRDVTERTRYEDMLARSEARLRGILDSAMDAIVTVDESQHIVLFNAAAESVFGCPREQAIGAPLTRFIPERFRTEHAGHIRRFGETGISPRRMGAQRIVTGLRRSGEEFPIDASISQITENGRRFFTVILRDVTERVRAEEDLRRSREELRELALNAHSVREQEKSRVARELHDELAQALTALKMDITWIRGHVPGNDGPVSRKLADIETLLDGTVAATRRISADLRPLMLDDLGLIPAAEWLVQKFTERTGIRCELSIGVDDLELQDPQASAVFRILQESLTNAARHAQASRVEVTIDRSDGVVALMVRDNGRGFSPQQPRKPGSYGLMGLRERAYLLGGEVSIASEPDRGTTIEVRIPLESRTVRP
jgi:PAS domain S-box-containing protein